MVHARNAPEKFWFIIENHYQAFYWFSNIMISEAVTWLSFFEKYDSMVKEHDTISADTLLESQKIGIFQKLVKSDK